MFKSEKQKNNSKTTHVIKDLKANILFFIKLRLFD